ncbi:hypothetical protein [Rhizobium rhizogenes]|uniref:hypothetical protein n=1 Tax=Rhizobium rhizogenes TaxID=359 RepID=UPI00068D137C|nr:hypothetical protein [Rhizobium rhizogenes]NTJ22243.1 hypothetical protein [Rhizobium rhizogenes]QUE80961.1 hypothetical protein EML492_03885 [Rhizobium rhizogenes]TQO80933.1 hypothetical protein FFE80_07515 [Rhizobium rhizogenes]TRB51527.1 hypothetical protein EXN69_26400 [Rhizobium rhizogenes]
MADFIYAGDGGAFKDCTKCGEIKPHFEYSPSKGGLLSRVGACKECRSVQYAKYRAENPEKIKAAGLRWYLENKEHATKKRMEWRSANPERDAETLRRYRDANPNRAAEIYAADPSTYLKKKAEWRKNNPEKFREITRKSREKSRQNPQYVLEAAIRNGVYRGIKQGSKAGKRTFDLLGYTSSELKKHIEKLFSEDMSWDNYGRGDGKWHIDHKIPLSAHNYSDPNHIDFKKAWAMENLQPMWEAENLSKNAKLFAPFQPSLALACG